jgi:predicted TPR repeat methyltransferase
MAQDDPAWMRLEAAHAISLRTFEKALWRHAEGDLVTAVDLYGDIAPDSPSFQEGQYFLGVALHHLGQHERSVDLLRASLAASDGRVDWANKLGNILTAQNRFAEAADVFEQALEKAPDQALLWSNLGAAREQLGDFTRSELAYRTAISLDPQSAETWRLLSALYERANMPVEAVRAYSEGYVVGPREATTPYLLGKAYYVLGRLEEAAEVYRAWKDAEPDNPVPAHLFAACAPQGEAGPVPDRCSQTYVSMTFDDYANHFEGKLSALDYRGPALLENLMAAHFSAEASLRTLDAGCGTGLCAPTLRPYATTLTGVDLSGAMLEIAAQRGLYEDLHKAEIGEFLAGFTAQAKRYDLIACMDTLIYFGAIETLFEQFAAALEPGGWLIFTTETCAAASDTYRINPSGRFSHSEAYLRKAMRGCGLECLALEHETLRRELARGVAGVIVLARKA